MDSTIKKEAARTDRLSNTTHANHTTMKARIKHEHAVCLLALWGLITPKAATAILKALGVRHA